MSGMEMYLTDQDIAMSKIEQHFEGSEDGMPANVQEEFDANAHRLGRLDIHMTNVREAGRQLYVWGILIINLAFAASIVSHLHAILRNLPSTRNKSIWKAISRLGDIFVSLLIEFVGFFLVSFPCDVC
ncbi:hypothetical protein BC832DRAFT_350330 [Gaertneriomyces semiglobifer]|nr:hypothetical protein BC832DRAFT_350330 [Gaertneriomyces semiglobifer]